MPGTRAAKFSGIGTDLSRWKRGRPRTSRGSGCGSSWCRRRGYIEAGQPIIVVKRKAGHGVHHGGAWKVAYADFVTAMMALFIVLWLMNSSNKFRKPSAATFAIRPARRTRLYSHGGVGREPHTYQGKHAEAQTGTQNGRLWQAEKPDRDDGDLRGLANRATGNCQGTFFNTGSSELNASGKELLTQLAVELSKLPNKVSIEGTRIQIPSRGRTDTGTGSFLLIGSMLRADSCRLW
jgi:chemotaxis protein MotB